MRTNSVFQLRVHAMTDLSFFSPEHRARRYRRFAAEAREKAAQCSGAAHFHHLMLADDWDFYAADIEATLRGAELSNSAAA
jgi:hypothetical protein